MSYPRVAVEPVTVAHFETGKLVTVGLLVLTCSECGDITDPVTGDGDSRRRLQLAARRHSDELHDGLVDAVGWSR